MKPLIAVLGFILVIAQAWVRQFFISPIGVVAGTDRVVAKHELPNGEGIEVIGFDEWIWCPGQVHSGTAAASSTSIY
jgi:hypothetical protein